MKTLEPILSEYGPDKIQALQADLSKENDAIHLFAGATSSFGPVHIIIVNHGIYVAEDVPLVQMSLKQWNSTMDIDLTSSFLVTREYLRGLQAAPENVKDYASIIFIGSCAGKFGNYLAFLLEATLKLKIDTQAMQIMQIMLLRKVVHISS